MRSPACLELAPPVARFSVQDGALALPESIASLAPPAAAAVELEWFVRDRIRALEALTGDARSQAEDELLSSAMVAAAARSRLAVRFAWAAQRRGDAERRSKLTALVAADAPVSARVSKLLLGAARGAAVVDAVPLLLELGADRRAAVCTRLGDYGIEVQPIVAETARALAQRERLRLVDGQLATLLAEAGDGGRALRVIDAGVLLFDSSAGRGALLLREELPSFVAALRGSDAAVRTPEAQAGTVVFDGFTDDDAVVFEDTLAVRARIAAFGWLSGSAGLGILALAFTLLLGGAGWFGFRALRREMEAARLRHDFVTTVTHELKTPLAGIRLVAELLTETPRLDEERRRGHLGRLSGEATRLGMLVENVLDLGRFERGEQVHAPEPVDMRELLRDVLALFAPLAERAGVAVDAQHGGDPVFAVVDRDSLQQALFNLLDNGLKYGAVGGRIVVSLEADGASRLRLSVRDYGPGVPESEREAIFARFARGREHQHGSLPGVGIGLHLARAIADRHGGTLTCRAPRDGGPGACFELQLARASTNEVAMADRTR